MSSHDSRKVRRRKKGTHSQNSFEFEWVERKTAEILKFPSPASTAEDRFRESVIRSLVRLRIPK
jgi:hypothetical protein